MSFRDEIGEEKYAIIDKAMRCQGNGKEELEAIEEALALEEVKGFDRGYLEHKKRMILATGKSTYDLMDDLRNSL